MELTMNFTFAVFAVIFILAGGYIWWISRPGPRKTVKANQKPPACPCGCARVGKFCARCGRPQEPPAVYLHEHSTGAPVYRSGSFDQSALWPHKSAAKTWHTSSSTFINMQWKLPLD